VVEGSRGAGHAWGASMRNQKSHLRTRIGKDGMDYKGFNIAIHEFGHNVEQTISLHDVDYYMMAGVPNTAFTEALAFIFQSRDLDLLGITDNNPEAKHLIALDKLWGSFEIMGVSLVDMAVWKWMYANPDATPDMLKQQTLAIAYDVWNTYYEPVIGVGHSNILAIYSHMISYPLYLSAYPIGRLIEFQLEQHMKGKNLASETDRVFSLGKLIPQEWMKMAVGEPISSQPMLDAAKEAVGKL
jgi:oligoendopeptidase F